MSCRPRFGLPRHAFLGNQNKSFSIPRRLEGSSKVYQKRLKNSSNGRSEPRMIRQQPSPMLLILITTLYILRDITVHSKRPKSVHDVCPCRTDVRAAIAIVEGGDYLRVLTYQGHDSESVLLATKYGVVPEHESNRTSSHYDHYPQVCILRSFFVLESCYI